MKIKPGFVRIIGGRWRSRRIKIISMTGLRPTPDRVRETLFNWLHEVIKNAYCLDLFAGSGVLGMEALSRGAKYVAFVDSSADAVKQLQEALTSLAAPIDQTIVYQVNIPQQLVKSSRPFDIIFMDPPYHTDLLLPTCFFLEKNGFLAAKAYIYLEASTTIKDNDLPPYWHIIKSQQAGQVFYHLVLREMNEK